MSGRDRDRGLGRFLEKVATLERGASITAGIHADAGAMPHRGSGGSVLDVAVATELGTFEEEPHSFIRSTIDGQQALGRVLAVAVARGLKSGNLAGELHRVADSVAAQMRAAAPSETGQLRAAIAGRVELR